MRKLSDLHARVYFVVKKYGPIGPTQIGHHLEFAYEQASASVTRPLRALMKHGLIERVNKNQRVVHYRAIHEITPPILLTRDGEGEDTP